MNVKITFDEDAIRRKAFEAAKNAVADRIKEIRCPVHGTVAIATPHGSTLETLEWQVHGCCHELVEKVKQTLSS